MKRIAKLALPGILGAVVSLHAFAQAPASKSMDMNKMDTKSMDMMNKNANKKAAASHSGTGVVKSIDPTSGSITLAHDPIKTLNWPAMTMAFKAKDKSLLDKLNPGDKVQFTVEQSGKDYVVTSIK